MNYAKSWQGILRGSQVMTKKVTVNITSKSLSDGKAADKVCVLEQSWVESNSRRVGRDGGWDFVDPHVLNKAQGVESHLSQQKA